MLASKPLSNDGSKVAKVGASVNSAACAMIVSTKNNAFTFIPSENIKSNLHYCLLSNPDEAVQESFLASFQLGNCEDPK